MAASHRAAAIESFQIWPEMLSENIMTGLGILVNHCTRRGARWQDEDVGESEVTGGLAWP